MQWLEKIRPPKFLRYMFYRIYRHDEQTQIVSTPIATAITVLWITHVFQLFFLQEILRIFFEVDIFTLFFDSVKVRGGKFIFLLFILFLLLIIWLFYSYKNKHLNYIKKFENETKSEKKRGIIYLFIYLLVFYCFL